MAEPGNDDADQSRAGIVASADLSRSSRLATWRRRIRDLSPRQALGVFLLVISTLAWLLVPVVPFLPMDVPTTVAVTVGLVVVGEATGYPGLALLGKEAVTALRAGWRRLVRRITSIVGRPDR